MILYEEIEQRSHSDVVIGARVGVAVDAEVEVNGDHRVVDYPAVLGGRYKANMKTLMRRNSRPESRVRRTKNFTRF